MRPSPFRHPLAVLRSIAGITQKELATISGCSTPTIQAVELGKLKLSESLALKIAHATGVDVAWLLDGDPAVEPRMGVVAPWQEKDGSEYDRGHYEYYRSFIEAKAYTFEEYKPLEAELNRTNWQNTPPGVQKAQHLWEMAQVMQGADKQLSLCLEKLLHETCDRDSGPIVRWKIRRLFEELGREHSVKLQVLPTREEALKVLEQSYAGAEPPEDEEPQKNTTRKTTKRRAKQ